MKYQICTRCVMDNVSDPSISFLEDGTCNYCNYALSRMDSVYFPNEEGDIKVKQMVDLLKSKGKDKEFDCIMGISGGLDSAYLAYLGSVKWGLRILGVHVDDGFDSPVAVTNINNLCRECKIKLINISLDKRMFMDLTRSFFLAGLPGICIPQDNALVATLFETADKYKLKYFLSGTNFALESILQRGNMHNASDLTHIKAVHKQFGTVPLKGLSLLSLFDRYIKYKYIIKQRYLRPLDWIDYNKDRAICELKKVGFDYYEGKHYESILTRFLQTYYMPKKFNIDIRKSHLSSLIIVDQMNREEVLYELNKPLYNEDKMEEDIEFILSNLQLSRTDFDRLMSEAPKKHSDYKVSWLTNFASIARKYRNYLSD